MVHSIALPFIHLYLLSEWRTISTYDTPSWSKHLIIFRMVIVGNWLNRHGPSKCFPTARFRIHVTHSTINRTSPDWHRKLLGPNCATPRCFSEGPGCWNHFGTNEHSGNLNNRSERRQNHRPMWVRVCMYLGRYRYLTSPAIYQT